MKSRHFVNVLAVVGALVVLIGVSAAANIAITGNMGTVEIHGSAHS